MTMTPPQAKNSGDPAAFLKRIENLIGNIEEMRADYQARAKEVREDIKLVYEEARDQGIEVKALRGLVKYRTLERKQDAIPDGLDLSEKAAYDNLIMTLGDLGRAAAERAGYTQDEEQQQPQTFA
jgi:uncharacterized protein (UPF0335 family)